MRLNWTQHEIQGFDDAFEHSEVPFPCKTLDADGNECRVPNSEVPLGLKTNSGTVPVPAIRVDTETGEVWWRKALDDGKGRAIEGRTVFKAPLKLVPLREQK